ncbi:hypothetical protein [Thermococcus sp. MAR1]|uniref:hypothetical protein n=1 Tax=Thermococcus sp. MAR1 TaxID=1638263 RepID=UPI00143C33B1|nr:hypothetical protein [Thermococcus sp. MAR1]NJE09490.1 hypothetical protein [Thermococcus sp. MAR1]
MRKTVKLLLLTLLSVMVLVGGCIGNTPSSTGTMTGNSEEDGGGTTSTMESSTTETGTTETVTETQTSTDTGTEAPTETPPNESLSYDEDGNILCEGEDPDLGCEAGETNGNGTGPGFSLNFDFNVSLTPVIVPVTMVKANFSYAGPISSMAFSPGERDVIDWISVLTSSRDPGKNFVFTIKFADEELAETYVHAEVFYDVIHNRKITYEPTVLYFDEGSEFGRMWELHLYSGGFTLYEVGENGLVELSSGNVDVRGSSVSFTIENFRDVFPRRVYMRAKAVPMGDGEIVHYPGNGVFTIEYERGWIDYMSSSYYGEPGGKFSLHAKAHSYDLSLSLYFESEEELRKLPVLFYIDSTDNGKADWIAYIYADHYLLKDSTGNVYREGKAFADGNVLNVTLENLFSLIPWRYFRGWFAFPPYKYRFPARANLWFNATEGLRIEKDVEEYLVIVVEDVYIKENGDYAEGEIQLTSWAYGLWWPEGKVWPLNYSSVYTFGYPVAHWVEAEDRSRLLYHDENATSLEGTFINGYPIFAMSVEEAKKYRRIYFNTMAWDRDEPGSYVTTGVGFLADIGIGIATGEISTALDYAYKGMSWGYRLTSGESASDLWGEVFEWLVGAEPDFLGMAPYSLDPLSGEFAKGALIEVPSGDGNLVVTYLVYTVEVPRTLRYAELKTTLHSMEFTKDTEWGDDEYYIYARSCAGFTQGEAELPEEFYNGHYVNVGVAVPDGHSYSYPNIEAGEVVYDTSSCSPLKKLEYRTMSGSGILFLRKELLSAKRADLPFLYIEYSGWEEDSGKWGNDDDPMGTVGITILLDEDYLDWEHYSAVPEKSLSLPFDVCGVSGGCSEVHFWVDIGSES